MLEIRRGTPAEYKQLTDQVVWSFRVNTPAHLRFEFFDRSNVLPDAETMRVWRLAFVDGELAGGLILVPRTMKYGDTVIKYAGIGHVHCFPKFRKAGVFSALMKRAIEDMNAEGFAISLLGGDRQRYGHYGWEHAGYGRTLRLEPGQMRFDSKEDEPVVTDFREYMGDDEDAKKILAARQATDTCPIHENFQEFKRILARPNRVIYMNERPQDGFAYMVVSPGYILEYGGSVKGVEHILKFILRTGTWEAWLPPAECYGPLEEMLDKYAQNLGIENGEQLRVNNMALTLKAYTPWLEKHLQGWSGKRVITLDDGESVAITVENGKVEIADGAGQPADMTLSRRDVAVLFFGPFLPKAANQSNDNFWRLAFPLPFYWPNLEHV